MKVGGEITSFDQVLKPYNFQDSLAKGLNESYKCARSFITVGLH